MGAILMTGFLLLTMGCGTEGGNDSAVPGPDEPVGTTVSPGGSSLSPVPQGSPSPVTPRGGTVDTRPVPWTSATPEGDGTRVRLVWWSGVEPCYTLDRVEVTESERQVTITVHEGTAQDMQNVACIEIAIEKTTTVELKSPLGDREIVDGAKN